MCQVLALLCIMCNVSLIFTKTLGRIIITVFT
jgi:hypothetical protein